MEPNLHRGDVVIGDRKPGDCGSTSPALGDVVLVRRDKEFWIRRVVAGPGQTVQMIGGRLHIDGSPVASEEVRRLEPDERGRSALILSETLSGGASHLVQDFGPGHSLDDTPEIEVPVGHWFTMGDNRDNAIDSRVDGPTSEADLCGLVLSVFAADPS